MSSLRIACGLYDRDSVPSESTGLEVTVFEDEDKPTHKRRINLEFIARINEWQEEDPIGGSFICEACGRHYHLAFMATWPRIYLGDAMWDWTDRTVCRLCRHEWKGSVVLLCLLIRGKYRLYSTLDMKETVEITNNKTFELLKGQ